MYRLRGLHRASTIVCEKAHLQPLRSVSNVLKAWNRPVWEAAQWRPIVSVRWQKPSSAKSVCDSGRNSIPTHLGESHTEQRDLLLIKHAEDNTANKNKLEKCPGRPHRCAFQQWPISSSPLVPYLHADRQTGANSYSQTLMLQCTNKYEWLTKGTLKYGPNSSGSDFSKGEQTSLLLSFLTWVRSFTKLTWIRIILNSPCLETFLGRPQKRSHPHLPQNHSGYEIIYRTLRTHIESSLRAGRAYDPRTAGLFYHAMENKLPPPPPPYSQNRFGYEMVYHALRTCQHMSLLDWVTNSFPFLTGSGPQSGWKGIMCFKTTAPKEQYFPASAFLHVVS